MAAPTRTDAEFRRAAARARQAERQARFAAGTAPAHLVHGKASTYSKWGCHCGPCTAAATAARTKTRPVVEPEAPPGIVHGSPAGYRSGCLCDLCLAYSARAKAQENATTRARRARQHQQMADGLAPASVKHGRFSTYREWGCKCVPCTRAAMKAGRLSKARAKKKAYDLQYPEAVAARRWVMQRKSPTVSVPAAVRRGMEWTSADLETVARNDLTAAQLAGLLGRTVYAVRRARSDLNRTRRLADVMDTELPRFTEALERLAQ